MCRTRRSPASQEICHCVRWLARHNPSGGASTAGASCPVWYAVWLLARAGYGSSAAEDGVAVLQLLQGRTGCAATELFRTHPNAESRRQNVQREQRRVKQEGAESLKPVPAKGEHDAVLSWLKAGALLFIIII